jgi:hypothetical protein
LRKEKLRNVKGLVQSPLTSNWHNWNSDPKQAD